MVIKSHFSNLIKKTIDNKTLLLGKKKIGLKLMTERMNERIIGWFI